MAFKKPLPMMIEDLTATITDLQAQIAAQANDISFAKTLVLDHEKRVTAAEGTIKTVTTDIATTQTDIATTKADVATLKTKVK